MPMSANGVSFSDFPGQRQRARRLEAVASEPKIPIGSADADTFGAAGSGPPSAVSSSMQAGAAVRGLLTLIGILVVIRVAWEFAEEATD